MAETKICNVCNVEKSLSEFYFRNDRNIYRPNCKKCKPLNRMADIMLKVATQTTKVCKHCNIEKSISEFQKAGGGKWLQPYCKPCDAERKRKHLAQNREKIVLRRKEYYQDNKPVILKKQKKYLNENKEAVRKRRAALREKDRDSINKKHREYGRKNKDKIYAKQKKKRALNPEYYSNRDKAYKATWSDEKREAHKASQKEYRLRNKDRIKAYRDRPDVREKRRAYNRIHGNKKCATDISFRLVKNLRSRIGFALKRNIRKSDTTKNLLGCSVDFFKEYFQSKFTDDMTWDSFMNGDIHIDHKKPCKEFDLTNPEEQKKCFHYKNLQPLWWYDNLKKGANYQEQKIA